MKKCVHEKQAEAGEVNHDREILVTGGYILEPDLTEEAEQFVE